MMLLNLKERTEPDHLTYIAIHQSVCLCVCVGVFVMETERCYESMQFLKNLLLL